MRVMPGATSRAPSARPDGSVQPTAPGLARARSLAARVWSDHRLFILVLAPAVLLRVDAELGYRWQSWFNDSFEYLANTISFSLDPTRVSGYSVWLRILEPFHSYALITILQHLEGLSVGVMVYALARHRFGAKAWIATLAAVPVLYDGFEIQLEHLILSDVPFLFLVMLATTLLLWNPAGPSTRMCAVIGLLLGLGAVLRSIGLPLVAVFAVYMIIRRVNWRKVAAAIVVCAIPVFGYAGVFYLQHGQFAMSDATGVFLYSRVMSFANCSVIHPPADELELCAPTNGTDSLGIAQNYIWTPPTPLDEFPPPKFTSVPNQFGENFAIRAIEAQPLGYLEAVVHDTVMAFGWKRIVFPQAATYDEYLFGTHSLPIPNWDRVDLGKYHTYASFYVRGNPLTQRRQPLRHDHPGVPGVRLAARHRLLPHPARRARRDRAGLAAAGRGGAAALGHLLRDDPRPGGDRRVRLPVRAAGRAVRLPGRGHGLQPGHGGPRRAGAANRAGAGPRERDRGCLPRRGRGRAVGAGFGGRLRRRRA